MNANKHTPGPWSVGGSTGLVNQIAILPCIGVVYGAGDEIKANAALIAAAPELAGSLVEVMEWIGNWDPNFTYDPAWKATRAKAYAAMAKAGAA